MAETKDNWKTVPDKTEYIYNGAALPNVKYPNPIVTWVNGLDVLIHMFDNKFTIKILNGFDSREGWRYKGVSPIPLEKLFKFLKDADHDKGRCSLQFNNDNRREMRLVIWDKHDRSRPLNILEFDFIDDPVEILQIRANWDRAKLDEILTLPVVNGNWPKPRALD